MTAEALRTFAPSTVQEAAAAMLDCARAGDCVTFRGGGTKLAWGNPLALVHAQIDTANLDAVVEYEPADLVVTAQAGMTLAALQLQLARRGQRLALDPPLAQRATLGGLIATNDYGPLRTRFGTLRDVVIGMQLIRADGALVRGGGKVVKNVAGFDVPKLLVGSFGTLGLVATVTFKLHPLPEATSAAIATIPSLAQARALVEAIVDERLEPAAVYTVGEATGPAGFVAEFEGFSAGVDEQVARFLQRARALGLAAGTAGAAERDAARRRHDSARAHTVCCKLAFLPSELAEIERTAIAPLFAALKDGSTTCYPTEGLAFVGGDCDDLIRLDDALRAVRELLEERGGSLVLQGAPVELRGLIDAWGTPPPSAFIMEALKSRFDPEHRLNRGIFVGAI